MIVKLAAIFFSMILVNNYVLVKFYGICPFLGVSKKLDSSLGMSGAVIFVMLMATAVTFPIQILFWTRRTWATCKPSSLFWSLRFWSSSSRFSSRNTLSPCITPWASTCP